VVMFRHSGPGVAAGVVDVRSVGMDCVMRKFGW